MKRALFTVGGGVLVVVVAASWLASQASLHAASSADPLRGFDFSVTRDGIWYDGKAETCVYDGTRDIYGESRAFKAIVHTNKERYSSKTKTKNDRGAREVFKHHVIEVIPTENYDYKMSTMVYVDGDDLSPVKIDMGSHEDCGATFKQFIYEKGELSAHQFSYFPNEGHREASNKVSGFAFQDSLSVVLRAYPFDSPRDVPLKLLADQTTTKWSPMSPTDGYAVRYVGKETLDLPVGKVAGHHLRVSRKGGDVHDYWFAANGKASGEEPGLHVMLQYKGPGGLSYQLRSQQRGRYWVR